MQLQQKCYFGIAISCILYNILHFAVGSLPNPIVPGGYIAINLIVPIITGYMLGPWSGAMSGAFSIGINMLFANEPLLGGATIFPIMVMGFVAGSLGKRRSAILSSLSIIVGHVLNIVYFVRLGIMEIELGRTSSLLLMLLSETVFDIVLIIAIISIIDRRFYQKERW